MKRKHESQDPVKHVKRSKAAKGNAHVQEKFGPKLFSPQTVKQYKNDYAESEP